MQFNLIWLTFKMELYKIYVFNVFLLLSFFRSSGANSVAFISNIQSVNACAVVNCGQGTCHTDLSLLGFDCVCYSGWKKFQIGPVFLPPCIIPNCTLNLGCGKGSPSVPPPLPPPPPLNLSDPCTLTWCGDGTCKSSETGYECDCNAGSDNFLNMPALPCFKECSLGADCDRIGLGTPPPPDSNSSPPNKPSSSQASRELRTASIIKDSLTLLILAALFSPWL